MTVKEYYDATGGGYEKMSAKFSSDAMIIAFLKIFKRDTSFNVLAEKLTSGDVQAAFNAAHTLKGVVLNLNLEGLIQPVISVTEALRAGNLDSAKQLFPILAKAYSLAVNELDKLLA